MTIPLLQAFPPQGPHHPGVVSGGDSLMVGLAGFFVLLIPIGIAFYGLSRAAGKEGDDALLPTFLGTLFLGPLILWLQPFSLRMPVVWLGNGLICVVVGGIGGAIVGGIVTAIWKSMSSNSYRDEERRLRVYVGFILAGIVGLGGFLFSLVYAKLTS